MGDFSRDTFKLTNAMHQLLSGETVTDPRHYVGVRLQQGVPVLDADWNELGDIARSSHELLVRDVIGDGVPGQGTGFAVGPLEVDNDFALQPGVLIVGGWQVINPSVINYSRMSRFINDAGTSLGTDLTTPTGDRTDIVYLDVWETEIAGVGTKGDSRLVNESIGLETARRVERSWTVRVAENTASFAAVGPAAGHKHYPLAKLYRSASGRIFSYMIEDLRRLGLTLADGIKTPLFLKRGSETIDPTRFSTMLTNLSDVLQIWQGNALFPIEIVSIEKLFAFQNSLNRIYNLVAAAEVACDTRSLDNQGALTVLTKLADAQDALLQVLRDYGTGVPEDMAIVEMYQVYLDGDQAQNVAGVRPALANNDLVGAVKAQEELTTFLGLRTNKLPEGSVVVTLMSVTPATKIAAGVQLTLTYQVKSELLSPLTPEKFDFEAIISDSRWASTLMSTSATLAPSATATVVLKVTPDGSLAAGDFTTINLIARANRRPAIHSVQPAKTFTVDQLPPGESFFFYNGATALDLAGVLHIAKADIESTTYDVIYKLINATGGAQEHTFRINYELVWSGAAPAGWLPGTTQEIPSVVVSGADDSVTVPLRAPNLGTATNDISVTLRATATLIQIDGTPIPSGKSSTIDLPIIVEIA